MNTQTKQNIIKKLNNPPKKLKDVKSWAEELLKEATGEEFSEIKDFNVGDVFKLEDLKVCILKYGYCNYSEEQLYFLTGLDDDFLLPYSNPPVDKKGMLEHLNMHGYKLIGKLDIRVLSYE